MGNAVAPAGFRVVNIDMNDPEALAQMQRVFTESLAGMVAPQLPSDAAIEAARSGARAALAASIAKVPLPSTEHTLCAMVANTGQRLIAGTPVHLISDDYLRCDDPDTEPSEDVMVVTRYNHKTGLVGVGPQLECGPFFHPIQTILSSVRVHNIAEAALCVDVLRGERQDNECAAVPQLLRRFEETGSIRAQHKIAVKHAVWDLSFGQLKYHAVAQILDAEAQPPAREHSSSTETLAKVLATGGHKRLIWGFFDIKVDVDLPVRIVSISPTLHARSGVLPRGHDNDEEQIEARPVQRMMTPLTPTASILLATLCLLFHRKCSTGRGRGHSASSCRTAHRGIQTNASLTRASCSAYRREAKSSASRLRPTTLALLTKRKWR